VLSVDKVLQEIAHVYGISLAEIMSDSRKQWTVRARSCAMYCAKNRFNWTLERIWDYFWGKHHTSVMHAINTFESMLTQDHNQQSLYSTLKTNVWI
jgi:chromosomal replication initiator protein